MSQPPRSIGQIQAVGQILDGPTPGRVTLVCLECGAQKVIARCQIGSYKNNGKSFICRPCFQSRAKNRIEVSADGRTAAIDLTGGHTALVDAEDIPKIKQHRWRPVLHGNAWYARTNLHPSSGKRSVYMHALLCDYSGKPRIDHINQNGLDNRRANLRPVTPSENGYNRTRSALNRSGFKGVSRFYEGRERDLWRARITVDRRRVLLGLYYTPEDAARAYDDAARRFHGQYARLNFPQEGENAA